MYYLAPARGRGFHFRGKVLQTWVRSGGQRDAVEWLHSPCSLGLRVWFRFGWLEWGQG